jgi:hypothetical protein
LQRFLNSYDTQRLRGSVEYGEFDHENRAAIHVSGSPQLAVDVLDDLPGKVKTHTCALTFGSEVRLEETGEGRVG